MRICSVGSGRGGCCNGLVLIDDSVAAISKLVAGRDDFLTRYGGDSLESGVPHSGNNVFEEKYQAGDCLTDICG